MKLNLGCSSLDIDGEIGVDCEKTSAVKVIASILALPFNDSSAESIRLDHALEHIPGRQAPLVLLEAWRVLEDGGQIRVGVPDLKAMCQEYVERQTLEDKALLVRWLYGSQVHDGEYHMSGWDTETLKDLLTACGFQDVTVREATGRSCEGLVESICIVAEGIKRDAA